MWTNANDFDRLAMQGEDTGVDETESELQYVEYVGSSLCLRGCGWVMHDKAGTWFTPQGSTSVYQVEPGDYKIL